MNLKEQLKAALARVKELADAATAEGREFTDEEAAEIEAKSAEVEDLRARIKKAEELQAKVKSLSVVTVSDDEPEPGAAHPNDGRKDAGDLAERFVKSEAYEAFQKEHPSGVGQGTPVNVKTARIGGLHDVGRKADPAPLATPDAHVAPLRYPTVDLTYPKPLTLLDLITRGQTGGAFEYLQVTAATSGAGIVGESTDATDDDTLKGLSDLTTALADAKVYTYADGFTVTNQMFSDAPALVTFLRSRLGYNLEDCIEDKLLSGAGSNGEPAGILNTTGVQSQAAQKVGGGDAGTDDTVDPFRTVRKAITRVTKIGGQVTAVLLSPEDDEEWDLAQDGNDRYYGQGPFGSGPGTAWGRPRVVSQRLTKGQFILGDFRTVTLLDREGLSVLAFNQHADYARRNLTYVRAELRAAQAIFEPAKLVIGSLTAPADEG